jgi:UDP-N-acetylmuramoyl-tripeptide--D-alanyl-D-alanine ligase
VKRVRFLTSELTAHLGGDLVGPDVGIEGTSIDSRRIRFGQLYAPIVAERDGHAFIPAALEAGTPAYLTARGWDTRPVVRAHREAEGAPALTP